MSYNIVTVPSFDRQLKFVAKKHRSISKDFEKLLGELEQNPKMGTIIAENCYKIRMSITSKGKGKSGGARVITFVYVLEETVFLLSIYDKSESASISDRELQEVIKGLSI